MTKPFVSVIISNFNYGAYLEECIKSALSQDYESKEVIVVDDGSTDGSRDVISAFSDQVSVIKKENGGQASCWNRGFDQAAGSIIIFLDADDVLAPGVLKQYASVLADHEVCRCEGYMEVVDLHTNKVGERIPQRPIDSSDLLTKVLAHGPGCYINSPSSGNAWSATFIRQVLPLPDNRHGNPDALLSDIAPLFGRTVVLGETVGFYRRHSGSLTAQYKKYSLASIKRILEVNENRCQWIEQWASKQNGLPPVGRWRKSNWRIVTLRFLQSRLEERASSPSFKEHLASALMAQKPRARLLAVGVVLLIRIAPWPIAFAAAKRVIDLRFLG